MRRALLPLYISALLLLSSGCTKELKTYRLSQNDAYVSQSGNLVRYKGNGGIRLTDDRYFRINSYRVLLDPNPLVNGDEITEPIERGRVYTFEHGYNLEVVDTEPPKVKVTKKLDFWGSVWEVLKPW